jgi:RNA polymerase sigma-70 factor (ECF subfamily)
MPISPVTSTSGDFDRSRGAEVDDGATIELSWDTPESFGEIFDRHYTSIFAFSARRVGPAQAEDVVNETFCRAFDRRRRYDTKARPNARPWLMGIAINVMRHEFRRQLRESKALGRISVDDYHPDHDTSVVDGFETANQIERVQAALSKLPDHELEPLLLSVLELQTYEQIADVMQVPIGTVRSRIHRARKHLSELIADFSGAISNPSNDKEGQ